MREGKKHSVLVKQIIGWCLRGIAILILAIFIKTFFIIGVGSGFSFGFFFFAGAILFEFFILSLLIFSKFSFGVIKLWVFFVLFSIWGWLGARGPEEMEGPPSSVEGWGMFLELAGFIVAYFVIVHLLKKAGVKKLFDGEAVEQKEEFPAKLTFIIILFLLFFVGPVLALFFYMPDHGGYSLGTMDDKCKDLASNLRIYYQDCNENSVLADVNGFIDLVVDEENLHIKKFSKEEPFGKYVSEDDFGVCFYLPEKLGSETEVLIGHTTLIKSASWEYGVVFTLNGIDISTEMLGKEEFVNLIGEEKLENLKPDIYYWQNVYKYLVDMEMEREEDVSVPETGNPVTD